MGPTCQSPRVPTATSPDSLAPPSRPSRRPTVASPRPLAHRPLPRPSRRVPTPPRARRRHPDSCLALTVPLLTASPVACRRLRAGEPPPPPSPVRQCRATAGSLGTAAAEPCPAGQSHRAHGSCTTRARCASRGRPSERRTHPRGRAPCARLAAGRARAVRVGRPDATGVGHTHYASGPSANSAQCTRLILLISDLFNSLQIQKLCRILLNSKNYETNFVGNV
jgi:hypothetical protein